MTKLKPCPHCGGRVRLDSLYYKHDNIVCPKCHLSAENTFGPKDEVYKDGWVETESGLMYNEKLTQMLIDKWNKRCDNEKE